MPCVRLPKGKSTHEVSKMKSCNLFKEVITVTNIVKLSEAIALAECKFLIARIGMPMIEMRKNLLKDIYNKNNCNYTLSDSYDCVQQIALLLSLNMGKRLTDVHHIDKKGKPITIHLQAMREMSKLIGYKMRRSKTDCSLETIANKYTVKDTIAEEPDDSCQTVDRIIDSLNLNKTQLTALQCRMSGMSYPEIAKIIQRAISTTYDCLRTIEKRYKAIYG